MGDCAQRSTIYKHYLCYQKTITFKDSDVAGTSPHMLKIYLPVSGCVREFVCVCDFMTPFILALHIFIRTLHIGHVQNRLPTTLIHTQKQYPTVGGGGGQDDF